MVKEIFIYLEGGGNSKDNKVNLREGFYKFLKEITHSARDKRIKLRPRPCGSVTNTIDAFRDGLKNHPSAFNILLVDSEGPVSAKPWDHLRNLHGDKWRKTTPKDENCHLMVQMMEAWFVGDIEALKNFYGEGFKTNSIPKNKDVESIDKDRLKSSLKQATAHTKRGSYNDDSKARHAPEILMRLDSHKVRKVAKHCDRLFKTLEAKIGESR